MPELDLAVLGASQVELCFGDLPRLPAVGEELFSSGLEVRPLSAALTAISAQRLGLRTVLATPLATDFPGRFLRHLLEVEGVCWLGPESRRSGLLVDFGMDCGPALQLTTTECWEGTWPKSVPRAAAGTPAWLAEVPVGVPRYLLPDGTESLAEIADLDAVCVIATEDAACRVAGQEALEVALAELGKHWPTVVVDRGEDGVVAVTSGATVRLDGAPRPRNPLRAGHSLFIAAYLWGDAQGLDLLARLRWAILHGARGDLP
jgi:sugar/nucleoside kinase (ribokinase family)